MKSGKNKKKRQTVFFSRKTVKGKVRLLSVLFIAVGILTYLLVISVLPKDSPAVLHPEAESIASGKPTTSSNPVIIEAEDMSYLASPDGIQVLDDTTASGESAKLLTINSTIIATVTLEKSVSKIIVTAKGDNCHGWPNASINIGGITVFDKKITSSSWRDVSNRITLEPGYYSVTLTYNNDYSNQNCNRNLMIDKITLL